MEAGQSLARSTRLAQIQHFLLKTPGGLTTRELARLCSVTIRTIQRDLGTLESDLGVPLTKKGDRYGILAGYFLPPVSFSLYEATALFMASRLVSRQIDENNPHIQSALTKMASVLPSSLAQQLKESIRAIGQKPPNADFIHIFEQVAIAWSTQRRMKIWYQSLQSNKEKEWLVEPYFVDMTGVGYSTYVIGRAFRKKRDEITTFKMERIRKAEILEESFEIPSGLDLASFLYSSWGIMVGEEKEVKLRFSPQVTRRVRESIWHPSQTITELSDGGCLFTLKVGGTLEITPWIRGWGADVEVLAPDKLRKEMIENAQRTLSTYKDTSSGDRQ